jgi:hypothetical protein
MQNALRVNAVGFLPVVKAKANAWFRATMLIASIPEADVVAMTIVETFPRCDASPFTIRSPNFDSS